METLLDAEKYLVLMAIGFATGAYGTLIGAGGRDKARIQIPG
jgi:hypothetical protein